MPILQIQRGNLINQEYPEKYTNPGFSIAKWSDDDDWHPITPFRGKLR